MLEYDRKQLGQFVQSAREKAGLTQAQASEKFGYSSPQFISNIERGTSVAPLSLLGKMIRVYKADPQALTKMILKSQEALLTQKLLKTKGKR